MLTFPQAYDSAAKVRQLCAAFLYKWRLPACRDLSANQKPRLSASATPVVTGRLIGRALADFRHVRFHPKWRTHVVNNCCYKIALAYSPKTFYRSANTSHMSRMMTRRHAAEKRARKASENIVMSPMKDQNKREGWSTLLVILAILPNSKASMATPRSTVECLKGVSYQLG